MSKTSFIFVFAAMGLLWVAVAHAQGTTATLSGTVVDPTGAVVPGASIKLLNTDTSLQRETTTSNQGYFTLPLLPPGRYSLRAQMSGFTPIQMDNIVLNVNDQIALIVQLKVATLGEQVTVIAEPSRVNTSPAVGTVVDRQFLNNLPLNGRSFQSLILLTPGVVVTSASGNSPGQFSVNGQRSNANYFTVDGVSANIGSDSNLGSLRAGQMLAGALPGFTTFGGTNGLVSVDALEEFKIQTSTYSAEFGRQPGGQISLVTRSGTNRFSGTLFEYFRNDALDANDWFANAAGRKKAPLRQNQFGGTFGGPVIVPALYNGRNRTFFFFSYEGLRLRLPQAIVTTVPSLRLREIAAPTVKPILAAFPLPDGPELLNAAGQPTGFSPLTGVYSDPSTLNATSIRIDHTVKEKLALFGRYNHAPSNSATRIGAGLSSVTQSDIATRTLTLGATASLTPRLTNELRLNISENNADRPSRLDTFGGAVPFSQRAQIPNLPEGVNVLSVVSVSFPSGTVLLNLGRPQGLDQRQMNLVDNVSWARGAHQLKFGIDFRGLAPVKSPSQFLLTQFSSEARIRSQTADLLLNRVNLAFRPTYVNTSVYGQDRWKLSRRLTLDFGLRWEVNPAPGGDGKKLISVIGLEDLPTARLAPLGSSHYKTDYRAVAPRVGVSYQVSEAKGWERVLRGGFGVFYDLGSGQAGRGITALPFVFSTTTNNVPFPVPPELAAAPPSPEVKLPLGISVTNSDLKLPYTLQWNIALEQSLGLNQSLSASYVAAVGRRLLRTGLFNNPIAGQRPNPNFLDINYTFNGATADYHSLQLQFQRRPSRGLQALVNYTWSHAIDEVSDETSQFELTRGNSSFDVRHNLSSAITYNLPQPRSGETLRRVIGNWSVDGIVHAQSATPMNLLAGFARLLGADGTMVFVRPDVITGQPLYLEDSRVAGGRKFNSAAFQAPPAGRQGTLGRNVLRGLALYQVDLALRRQFNLTERANVQIKVETFNVFNHPNFGNFGMNVLSPSTLGVPTRMLGRSLGDAGLSPLYQIGGPRSLQFSLRVSF